MTLDTVGTDTPASSAMAATVILGVSSAANDHSFETCIRQLTGLRNFRLAAGTILPDGGQVTAFKRHRSRVVSEGLHSSLGREFY
jgi:hypothetical protein